MAQTQTDKLELFEQSILHKAALEKDEILRATEAQKREALDLEESRLLEDLYRRIQAETAAIKTANVKEISRETLRLKKQLYQQREQYLIELLAHARVELSTFVKGAEYEGFLLGKVESLAKEYRFEGSVLRLRAADLQYADRIRTIYGDCTIEAGDEDIAIGGVILLNQAHGIEVDLSLDAALAEQKTWFYTNSNFNFDEAGEPA